MSRDAARPAGGADSRDRIRGIFSTQAIQKVGTGTTVRRTIQKSFWMCVEQPDESIEIQPLNSNCVPSGPRRIITKDELLQKFSPEPEFYINSVYPAMQELNNNISQGEEHRQKGEYLSAEHRFQKALAVDVNNVRANFGLGLTYLERGEVDKADNIFDRLVRLDAAFAPEHKHLFNEFGINLRKNKMYDQALSYYSRALSLSKGDEHLHYNIARAHFEKSQLAEAASHLDIALTMNPGLEAARKFKDWLQSKGLLPQAGTAPQTAT
ncbi:MAG: tetratricopeptide repeat protein [Desulfovibrio sp.]|nr:tetratricopeptide repeat protein [Desulfovibrio sp.]MCA1985688.1 tetratricopeptide repeat protein [Desulfovibrio sp.]